MGNDMVNRRSVLVGAFGVLACSAAAGAEPVTVVLDWLLNSNHAALFAAQNCGAFARAGLDVKLLAPSDPDLPPRLVAAGQADFGVSYGTQINMIDTAGLNLLRIATLIDRPLNTVMALAGRGISTLADLKGKRVGVSVGGVEDALLEVMLNSAGLAIGDVVVTKVNYDMVAALLTHRLDAAIGAFRNAEVLQVQLMGRKPVVFLPEEHGVPEYDELIVVARADRRTDPKLARFVSALREGTQVLLENPDAMWRAFAGAHVELDTKFNALSWKATMPAIAADPAKLDAARYLAFQQFAVDHGIAARALPLESFAVQIGV